MPAQVIMHETNQGVFMFFKVRKLFVLHFALILALLSGLFGTVPEQASAAPQAQVSSRNVQPSSESNICDPNSGWVWTYGPLRPDVAQQAELALQKEGIESIIVASEYGEKDSCVNF